MQGHRLFGESECLVVVTIFGLFIFQMAMLSLGPAPCEAILGLSMAVLAVKWIRNPAPSETWLIRVILIAYSGLVLVDHLLVHQRPYTVLQFLVGPGAILLLAGATIEFERLDIIVFVLALATVATTVIFNHGIGSFIPTSGGVFLAMQPPDKTLGLKHLTGMIGYLLVIVPTWAYEHGWERRWYHYMGSVFGFYLVLFSTSRAFVESLLLFIAAMILSRACRAWRPALRIMALGVFSALVIVGSLALLIVPSFRDAATAVLPASVGADQGRGDVASGRDVLMLEHFLLFERDPIWGVGDFDIRDEFRNDEVVAASESYLSYTVARDGIGGFLNWLLMVALCWYAMTSGSSFKYAFSLFIAVAMINLGYFNNLYGFETFIAVAILFEHPASKDVGFIQSGISKVAA